MPLLNDADAVYVGATPVDRIYLGATQVWEPAASGPLVSDSFDRPNNTTSMGVADTGQVWTPLAGTWGIDTNRGYSVGSATNDRQAAIESGASDMTVAADVLNVEADATGGGGLLFRGVDSSNYWIFVAEPESTRWALYKRVVGTHTLVGSAAEAPASGRLSVACSGSTITCRVDGVTKITATDAAHETATLHGMRVYRFNAASSYRYDNFTVDAA